jgi:enamine deaminase RidA (YjgF/YER057c/UK114 family)
MRQNISSNSPYEPVLGFSRAVRAGNLVFVSGTVGWLADASIAAGAYAQARQAIANIEAALKQAQAELKDVVRTRIYVADLAHLDDIARAHREAFGDIRPASTLVEVRMASPEMLVEIEADAVIK